MSGRRAGRPGIGRRDGEARRSAGPMLVAMSRVAHAFWPRFYRVIAWLDPFTRPVWRRFGIGNVVEVVIPGRHTGRPRTLFLGLLRREGRTYVGHPDGDCAWTRNLDAAGGGEIVFHDGTASGSGRIRCRRATSARP